MVQAKINDWKEFFNLIKEKDYSKTIKDFLDEEYKNKIVYPPRKDMFNAFKMTPLDKVSVVIIGQDPYHEQGQAMGLSFSVPKGITLPPSLINIYKEIQKELGCQMDYTSGDLTYLAKQGVFLLNAILSVVEHLPLSHNRKEYELFFKDTLEVLDNQDHPIVFLLWGGYARRLKKYLNNPIHLILEAAHPSPLSANRGGWFGCGHFKKCNEFLIEHNIKEINWSNI